MTRLHASGFVAPTSAELSWRREDRFRGTGAGRGSERQGQGRLRPRAVPPRLWGCGAAQASIVLLSDLGRVPEPKGQSGPHATVRPQAPDSAPRLSAPAAPAGTAFGPAPQRGLSNSPRRSLLAALTLSPRLGPSALCGVSPVLPLASLSTSASPEVTAPGPRSPLLPRQACPVSAWTLASGSTR